MRLISVDLRQSAAKVPSASAVTQEFRGGVLLIVITTSHIPFNTNKSAAGSRYLLSGIP